MARLEYADNAKCTDTMRQLKTRLDYMKEEVKNNKENTDKMEELIKVVEGNKPLFDAIALYFGLSQ